MAAVQAAGQGGQAGSLSLVAFIQGLGDQLEALFRHPYCCVSVLRSLRPLSRQLLLRFACTGGDVSTALVSSWARPGPHGEPCLQAALAELAALRLLSRVARGGQASWALNPHFHAQLRHAMCSGLMAEQQVVAAAPPPAATPSPADLAAYARGQWEALLLYLVSGASQPPGMPAELGGAGATPVDVPRLLAAAGLMARDEYTLAQAITEGGFRFLLADTYAQLWGVVRQYLADLAAAQQQQGQQGQQQGAAPGGGGGGGDHSGHSGGGAELAVAVNFLLRLGLQAGRAMALGALRPDERAIAAHMSQLGLLMPAREPGGGQVWLHPTRLAAVLAGGGRAGEAAGAGEDGFVIVESNFRVYAYTTSAVQVAVLRVFVRCDALLPNLFVGTITRDSAADALGLGIGADQIVGFLRQHAHPRAAAKPPVVPPVVADQIRLWQQELRRLQAQPAYLLRHFESGELYASTAAAAERAGAVLWRSDDTRALAVAPAAYEGLKAHIRQAKAAMGL